MLLTGCPATPEDPKPDIETKPTTPTEQPKPQTVCANPDECVKKFNDTLEDVSLETLNFCEWDTHCDVSHINQHTAASKEIFEGRFKKYIKENKILTHDKDGFANEDGFACIHTQEGNAAYEDAYPKPRDEIKRLTQRGSVHRKDVYFDVQKCTEKSIYAHLHPDEYTIIDEK